MRLIRGAPGSGKTALVFREFKAALAEGRTDVRLIAPTATLVRHFQHELARDGVVISPRAVVSMNRFVRECAGEFATAPDGLLRLVVRDALRRLDPSEFAGIATTEGMAGIILESVRLLENAGCTAAKFASVRGLGAQAKALARVWLDVDQRLGERGFVSRPQLFAAAAEHTTASALWLDGFVSLSPIEREFLRKISSRCEISITAVDDPKDEVRRWSLECGARDQLMNGPRRRPTAVTVCAPTLEREADEIARRILELRAGGTAFRDIGVAVRDIDTYVPLLESAFERFGIPARFYFSRPLASHPAAIFLSGLIRCAVDGWEFRNSLAALRAHPGWSATAAFDRYDFAVREAMPGRGSEALIALAQDAWFQEKLAACFGIEAWTAQQRTPADWMQQFESWATAMYRPARIHERRIHEPGDMRDLAWLRTHAQGLRAWLDAIQTALAFWPPDSGKIGLTEFLAVAEAAVRSASVSVPDDRIETVHVMSALEARQWNLSALFLCGATDRDYPRKHARHLLLAVTDMDKLAREGIRIRTAEDQDADEQKLFDSLQIRASHRFIVTYPQHDAAGRGVLPSRYIEVAAAAARNCAPQPRAQRATPPHPGRISSAELLAELIARHQTVSTTHIEALAQCPFQFFAKKTLQLEPHPEKPHDRIGPREAGLILHETLQFWLEDRTQDFAAHFDKAFEHACIERHLPRGYRLEVERFTLRNVARAVSATHSWPVESSEAEVEVKLPLVDGVTMTGRVDRVDRIGGSDCVIIDYKSKKKGGMKRLVEGETALQGPLYALALRRQSGLNTVAMAYWAVRDNELHGWGEIPGYYGDNPLQPMPGDWENAALTRIAAKLATFFGGDISPAPTDEDSCRFCDARDCCRVEEGKGLVMIETARA